MEAFCSSIAILYILPEEHTEICSQHVTSQLFFNYFHGPYGHHPTVLPSPTPPLAERFNSDHPSVKSLWPN